MMCLFAFKKICCCIGEVVFEALKSSCQCFGSFDFFFLLITLFYLFFFFSFLLLCFILFCFILFFILAFKGVSVALLHTCLAIFSLHTNC